MCLQIDIRFKIQTELKDACFEIRFISDHVKRFHDFSYLVIFVVGNLIEHSKALVNENES